MSATLLHPKLNATLEQVADFCKKWSITEFALFGSILRDDFGPDSDVDCCVVFAPDHQWSLWDIGTMRDELSELFGGRSVDIVERRAMRNPFFRHRVLTTRRVIYAA